MHHTAMSPSRYDMPFSSVARLPGNNAVFGYDVLAGHQFDARKGHYAVLVGDVSELDQRMPEIRTIECEVEEIVEPLALEHKAGFVVLLAVLPGEDERVCRVFPLRWAIQPERCRSTSASLYTSSRAQRFGCS